MQYNINRKVNAIEAIDRGWLVVGSGVSIGEDVAFVQGDMRYRTKIGTGSSIDLGTIIYNGVSIGENTRISSNVRIEGGCRIGSNVFVGHSTVLRPGTVISDECTIGHLCVFEGDTVVQDNTLIHSQCHITKGVKIGSSVFIAPLFVGANDPKMCHRRRHLIEYKETPYTIGNGVRIAIGVTLLPGVVLGDNVVVGANSLVTKSVPSNFIVRGTPAIKVGEVPEGERL